MKLTDILAKAQESNLMRSHEKHTVELVFGSPGEADRFEQWCAENHIATDGWQWGSYTVTVHVTG